LPAAAPQSWLAVRAGVPAGQITHQRFRSARLDNERDVWLYTPPGVAPDGGRAPLLVVFDGLQYVDWMAAPTTLDNLTAAGRLPPVVAVFVGLAAPWNVSRLQELGGSPAFVDFLTDELLPWARGGWTFTDDPARTVVAGSSLGGLAASHAALRRPDVFGLVLSQSGSYGLGLAADYVEAGRLPLRFYLDAGQLETMPFGTMAPLLHANRHFRDVLRAKGYEVAYREFPGGHDYLWWRETIADALITLLA
jgi:enterochelin esterase family protein